MWMRPSRACVSAACMISFVMPGDLDVHLQRGDAFLGAGNLEIHVAEMIFIAQNVRQHGKAIVLP